MAHGNVDSTCHQGSPHQCTDTSGDKQLVKIRCGWKPVTRIVGDQWVKEVKSKPVYQLEVDKAKRSVGLQSLGLKYTTRLEAPDLGTGGPYPTINYRGVQIITNAGIIPLDKLPQKWWSSAVILEVLKIALFRFLCGCSDTHLGNLFMVRATRQVYSCDEMTFRPRNFSRKSLSWVTLPIPEWKVLFQGRMPKKVTLHRMRVWLRNPANAQAIKDWVSNLDLECLVQGFTNEKVRRHTRRVHRALSAVQ